MISEICLHRRLRGGPGCTFPKFATGLGIEEPMDPKVSPTRRTPVAAAPTHREVRIRFSLLKVRELAPGLGLVAVVLFFSAQTTEISGPRRR